MERLSFPFPSVSPPQVVIILICRIGHIESKVLKDLSHVFIKTFKNCQNLRLNIAKYFSSLSFSLTLLLFHSLNCHDDYFYKRPHQLPGFALLVSRHLHHLKHLQITVKSFVFALKLFFLFF